MGKTTRRKATRAEDAAKVDEALRELQQAADWCVDMAADPATLIAHQRRHVEIMLSREERRRVAAGEEAGSAPLNHLRQAAKLNVVAAEIVIANPAAALFAWAVAQDSLNRVDAIYALFGWNAEAEPFRRQRQEIVDLNQRRRKVTDAEIRESAERRAKVGGQLNGAKRSAFDADEAARFGMSPGQYRRRLRQLQDVARPNGRAILRARSGAQ